MLTYLELLLLIYFPLYFDDFFSLLNFASRMTRTRGGYNSSQSSHKRSTRGGGRRSTRDDYRYLEANISNDDMEDEDINEPFHQDMPSRSNNWTRGHR